MVEYVRYIVYTYTVPKVFLDGAFYEAFLINHCFINAQKVTIVFCNQLKFSIYEALNERCYMCKFKR